MMNVVFFDIFFYSNSLSQSKEIKKCGGKTDFIPGKSKIRSNGKKTTDPSIISWATNVPEGTITGT